MKHVLNLLKRFKHHMISGVFTVWIVAGAYIAGNYEESWEIFKTGCFFAVAYVLIMGYVLYKNRKKPDPDGGPAEEVPAPPPAPTYQPPKRTAKNLRLDPVLNVITALKDEGKLGDTNPSLILDAITTFAGFEGYETSGIGAEVQMMIEGTRREIADCEEQVVQQEQARDGKIQAANITCERATEAINREKAELQARVNLCEALFPGAGLPQKDEAITLPQTLTRAV